MPCAETWTDEQKSRNHGLLLSWPSLAESQDSQVLPSCPVLRAVRLSTANMKSWKNRALFRRFGLALILSNLATKKHQAKLELKDGSKFKQMIRASDLPFPVLKALHSHNSRSSKPSLLKEIAPQSFWW